MLCVHEHIHFTTNNEQYFLTNSELNVRTLQNIKVSETVNYGGTTGVQHCCPKYLKNEKMGHLMLHVSSLLKLLTDIHIYCAPRQYESSKPGVPKLLHVMACKTAALASWWEPLSQTNNDTNFYFYFIPIFCTCTPSFIFPPILCSPLAPLTGLGLV